MQKNMDDKENEAPAPGHRTYASAWEELADIMRQLRSPVDGCDWDRRQSFQSLVPHTLEEAYELAEVIETGDWPCLREELADLLWQVVYYSRLADEQGLFDLNELAAGLVAKLRRRHPGLASGASVSRDAGAWERTKRKERCERYGGESVLAGLCAHLPALSHSQKLQQRVADVGFDWSGPGPVRDKLREELDELDQEVGAADQQAAREELGDLFFVCVAMARHLNTDAEAVLRAANRKFERRFRGVEQMLRERGTDPEQAGLEEMEECWQLFKETEKAKSR